MQEKTYQEVAQLTGFEINKVKSYLQNGKRNLKKCIENT
jgi:RNA polymerase sigma-70 factor (ECF subfamily)